MTIETLQQEMIKAMKSGDKIRKSVLSTTIAQIKKAAIDSGCRDNIPESLVDKELQKAKKQAKESIDAAYAAHREDLFTEYTQKFCIISLYCPIMLETEEDITELFDQYFTREYTKPTMMRWLKDNYSGKVNMKIAAAVVDKIIKERA